MFICILTAILFAVATIGGIAWIVTNASNGDKVMLPVVVTIIGLLAFILVPWNFVTVDNGEVYVTKNLGQVDDVLEPGLHCNFYMTTSYVKLDTKVRQVDIVTASYSNDKQTMDISMTIQYKIDKNMAKEIVVEFGSLEALETRIQNVAIERTKSEMSKYTAEDIIQTRGTISTAVADAIETAVGDSYHVDIVTIALTDIAFSDAYEESVEQSMIANQEVIKAQAEAKKAEEIAKGQLEVAKQEAQAKIEAAKADAEAKRLAAEAEANAIAIKSLEVARMLGFTVIDENGVEEIKPNLTTDESRLISDYLKYMEYLNKWNGELPGVVTDGSGIIINPGVTTPTP